MKSSSAEKSLTWTQIQSYLNFLQIHDRQIAQLIQFKDDGVLEASVVETKLTEAIIQMHDTAAKILKENKILENIRSEGDLKKQDEISSNSTKQREKDNANNEIQQVLDTIDGKYEELKTKHE